MPETHNVRDCTGEPCAPVQAVDWPFWSRFQQRHAPRADLALFERAVQLRFTDGHTTLYSVTFTMRNGWPVARVRDYAALSDAGRHAAGVRRTQLVELAIDMIQQECGREAA